MKMKQIMDMIKIFVRQQNVQMENGFCLWEMMMYLSEIPWIHILIF